MLKDFNKKNSFSNTIKFIIKPIIDIFITFILKAFNLRFIITFYKIVISILKFNELRVSSR